ncbi:MAG: hypothetical protein JO053_14140 [Acidobacteria bacterium]|nr:hypothetical protein [Acidobacteriota bacterium]
MDIFSISCPAGFAGMAGRLMLPVRRLGQVLTYATYRDGGYEFPIHPNESAAIRSGELVPIFHFDGHAPTGIVLTEAG